MCCLGTRPHTAPHLNRRASTAALLQRPEQGGNKSTECAITHHQHHVSALGFTRDAVHELTDIRRVIGVDPVVPKRVGDGGHVQLLVCRHFVVWLRHLQ